MGLQILPLLLLRPRAARIAALLQLAVGVAFNYVYLFFVLGLYFGFDTLPDLISSAYPANYYSVDDYGRFNPAFFGVRGS